MRRFVVLAIIVGAGLVACSKSSSPTAPNTVAEQDLPIKPAWLASRVPDNALAYVRIPSPVGLTSGPKGNAIGPLMSSEAHTEWLSSVLDGLADNVAGKPGFDSHIVQWLVRHQRSALEIMVSPVPGTNTAPGGVIALQTDIASSDAFVDAFNGLAANWTGADVLPAGLDADGIGVIEGLPLPAVVSFDAKTQRMLMLTGAGATPERMQTARKALAEPAKDSPMAKLQARIDESGYGFFGWISTNKALAMGQMFVPPEYLAPVMQSGFDKAEAIAFGYGVSRGKTRLALLADVPQGDGMRNLIPVPDNALAIKTTADPKLLAVVSVPTLEQIKAIATSAGNVSDTDWQTAIDKASEFLGTDAEALYDVLAGELLYIREPVGSYSAFRVDNVAAVDNIIGEIAAAHDLTFETRSVRGVEIRHWKVPSMPTEALDEAAKTTTTDQAMMSALSLYAGIGTHLFWVYEDGYVIVADSPQVLIDRNARGANLRLSDWAQKTQRQDITNSVLALSLNFDGLPRFAHQSYVAATPVIADLAGIDLDIWSLPTADDLGLPERGMLGFDLITADDLLGFEFSYEHSPFDVLGGAGGVAVAAGVGGMLSAIAIPAYQDYNYRAKVAQGMELGRSFHATIDDFYATQGRFPNAEEIAQMQMPSLALSDTLSASVSVEPDSGVIVITFTGSDYVLSGSALYVTPITDESRIVEWQCSSDAAQRHLPTRCRDDS